MFPATRAAAPFIERADGAVIYLTRLFDCLEAAQAVKPARILSLLDPGDPFPEFPGISPSHHLKIEVDDIADLSAPILPPSPSMIRRIIAFGRVSASQSLLVHCHAGVSRSTAAILTILADRHPSRLEEICDLMATRAPQADPNRVMISLGDAELGLNGRLSQAAAKIRPTRRSQAGWVELSLR